jgi:hypothetical protein
MRIIQFVLRLYKTESDEPAFACWILHFKMDNSFELPDLSLSFLSCDLIDESFIQLRDCLSSSHFKSER